MQASYSPQPSNLIFTPQVPFSWTLRWAWARHAEKARYTLAGNVERRPCLPLDVFLQV